ncbi:MAG: phosphatase PAP2 family protein [Caldilineaceae bacterium]|nr:phosphatase PAP2 family protein [Caldilineaceae bacterium]MBP8109932.1 phosphatase PAP2 family protein [Caldilineaceae bacterium]MBP8123992.1 phosphatase PAP2 family protein [Caldilineaceae bacterium]MBP9074013.1 phosphatase PAP2 family protein [Caldilineaceae bacterium]
MQTPDQTRPTGERHPGVWTRLIDWARLNRPLAWLAGFTVGLALFLIWLPASVRLFFWHGLQANAILASMVLGFGLLALSLLWSWGQRIDAWTFLFFNLRGRRPAWLDRLMWGFTQIGNSMTSVALAGILFVIGHRLLAYELVLGTLTLWLVVELVKALVHRGRPFIRLTQARIVGRQEGGRSFPSGHTSQVFFVATLLVGYFSPGFWTVGLLYATALLVGVTRMYVGAHYPRDVLAGAILGSAWGLLGGIVYGYGL